MNPSLSHILSKTQENAGGGGGGGMIAILAAEITYKGINSLYVTFSHHIPFGIQQPF